MEREWEIKNVLAQTHLGEYAVAMNFRILKKIRIWVLQRQPFPVF